MHYVYVLESDTHGLYFGLTNDLRRRLAEHNRGLSGYTKRSQWSLIYYEAYLSRDDAVRREHSLKQHGQAKRHLKNRIATSRKSKS